MSAMEEVCLFLIWFRYHIPHRFLASIFQIPKTNATDCRIRMLHWFYNLLKNKISIGSWSWRQQEGAHQFWDNDTWLSFLVDGSEQECYCASDVTANIDLFSGKKGHPSLTILLWVTLSGRILHLSKSFAGSRNDPILLASEEVLDWSCRNNFIRNFQSNLKPLNLDLEMQFFQIANISKFTLVNYITKCTRTSPTFVSLLNKQLGKLKLLLLAAIEFAWNLVKIKILWKRSIRCVGPWVPFL